MTFQVTNLESIKIKLSNKSIMKRMKYLLSIILLVPFVAFSQPVTQGLINYWPLDGNANDESASSVNGILTGTTPFEDRSGNQSGALSFNGASDHITFNGISTTSGTRFIFDKRTGDNGGAALLLSSGNLLRLSLNAFDALSGSITLTGNAWNHVSIRRSGSVINFFINGVKQAVSFNSAIDASNNQVAKIGTRSFSTPLNSFGGSLDDFTIYERALSDGEIERIYDPAAHSASCEAIFCDGQNVAIGTTFIPTGYQLAVDGKAIVEEVKVQNSTNWPDYVFTKAYELKTLKEVQKFIQENGHLPNIPSASEVDMEGIQLGLMNAKLLEKIEELTLYTLEQEDQLVTQKSKLATQESKLATQDKLILSLIERIEKLEK